MLNLNVSVELGDSEKNLLKKTLKCNSNDELVESLTRIAKAAFREYLEMILGKQLPTRANEIYERRLFHLLKYYYTGKIPSEAEVASMFQITQSSSRTLLRNVRAKFKYDLEEELLNTIQETLRHAVLKGDSFRVVIQCENILEELQQTVSIKAPQLDQISKVKGSAGIYNIPEDTFTLLANHFGVDLAQVEAATARE